MEMQSSRIYIYFKDKKKKNPMQRNLWPFCSSNIIKMLFNRTLTKKNLQKKMDPIYCKNEKYLASNMEACAQIQY